MKTSGVFEGSQKIRSRDDAQHEDEIDRSVIIHRLLDYHKAKRQRTGAVWGDSLNKIVSDEKLFAIVKDLKQAGRRIVFTNGCFDLLHPGHISYLKSARLLGDVLVVGVNGDRSVRALKGDRRPILNEDERCLLLSGLEAVSYVTLFRETTPIRLIQGILPDVLVKGGDWGVEEIVGKGEVEANGGQVISLPYETGQSTSGIIERILRKYARDASPSNVRS